jgi:integrase
MVVISQRHETKGLQSPCKTPLVKGVWEGLQRKIGVEEKGKEALWLHELREVNEALPIDKLIGIRNRALLVIGWVGAFRRSELVGINIEDISKHVTD